MQHSQLSRDFKQLNSLDKSLHTIGMFNVLIKNIDPTLTRGDFIKTDKDTGREKTHSLSKEFIYCIKSAMEVVDSIELNGSAICSFAANQYYERVTRTFVPGTSIPMNLLISRLLTLPIDLLVRRGMREDIINELLGQSILFSPIAPTKTEEMVSAIFQDGFGISTLDPIIPKASAGEHKPFTKEELFSTLRDIASGDKKYTVLKFNVLMSKAVKTFNCEYLVYEEAYKGDMLCTPRDTQQDWLSPCVHDSIRRALTIFDYISDPQNNVIDYTYAAEKYSNELAGSLMHKGDNDRRFITKRNFSMLPVILLRSQGTEAMDYRASKAEKILRNKIIGRPFSEKPLPLSSDHTLDDVTKIEPLGKVKLTPKLEKKIKKCVKKINKEAKQGKRLVALKRSEMTLDQYNSTALIGYKIDSCYTALTIRDKYEIMNRTHTSLIDKLNKLTQGLNGSDSLRKFMLMPTY